MLSKTLHILATLALPAAIALGGCRRDGLTSIRFEPLVPWGNIGIAMRNFQRSIFACRFVALIVPILQGAFPAQAKPRTCRLNGVEINPDNGAYTAGKTGMVVRNFDADKPGEPPTGFEFARTGQGADGKWVVRAGQDTPQNHVLVQESTDPTDYRFPLALVKEGSYKDVSISVRARPVSGEVDQGFGLVWRYQNADNYYVTRCNADEDNCTIYHTLAGNRRAFQSKSIKVAKNAWHTLKVEATGNHFVVWFDGKKVIDASDGSLKNAGRVGLWTKADSVIQFDDLAVIPK